MRPLGDTSSLFGVARAGEYYRRLRALDVTGNGRSDTLMLVALGTVPESLTVEFSVISDGDTVGVATWRGNSILMGDFDLPPEARDEYVRAALTRTLTGVRVQPFADSSLGNPWPRLRGAEEWAEDAQTSFLDDFRLKHGPAGADWRALQDAPLDTARARAIMTDIHRSARSVFVISYGYETMESYAWSPLARRFYVLDSCC